MEPGMATVGYLLLLAVAGVQPAAPAQVFKCSDGGQVSYQSAPCRGPPARTWIVPPPGPVPGAAAAAGSQPLRSGPKPRRAGTSTAVRRNARPREDACAKARKGREAAYRRAGLKRGFALSSYWDNRVHDACR